MKDQADTQAEYIVKGPNAAIDLYDSWKMAGEIVALRRKVEELQGDRKGRLCGRINFYCPSCSVSGEIDADSISFVGPGETFKHKCHFCETQWVIKMTFTEVL